MITGLVTEAIKKVEKDKENFSANITALVTGLIVGVAGTFIYYQLTLTPVGINDVIYALLLGGASGLAATLGFDKVKQALEQITSK